MMMAAGSTRCWGQDGSAAAIPDLSLESIYHPAKKFEHVTGEPSVQWVFANPDRSRVSLVGKTGGVWQWIDPENGDRRPWRLAKNLALVLSPIRQMNDDSKGQPAAVGDPWIDPIIRSIRTTAKPMVTRVGDVLVWIDLPAMDQPGIDRANMGSAESMTKPGDGQSNRTTSGEGFADRFAGVVKIIARDAAKFDDVTVDPTARRIGYTIDGDMYVHDLERATTRRLTEDGSDDRLSGRLDWIYQEEIFGRGNFRGFWFSPDGNHVAVLKIDNASVAKYQLGDSSSPSGIVPATPYPLPGQPIPVAWLTVFDLQSQTSVDVIDPVRSASKESIVTGVWWHPISGELLYCVSDRYQQRRDLMRWSPSAGHPKPDLVLSERSDHWIEPPQRPIAIGDQSILWYSQVESGVGRVFKVNCVDRTKTAITPEHFHVRQIQMVAKDLLAITGCEDPTEQHVYLVNLNHDRDSTSGPPMRRITNQTGWHSPDFAIRPIATPWSANESFDWIDSHCTIDRPATATVRTTRWFEDGPQSEDRFCISDSKLRLKEPLMPSERVSIPVGQDVSVTGWLTKPIPAGGQRVSGRRVGSQRVGGQRAGVVIEVYGGPQSSVATNRWHGNKRLRREFRARRGIATLVVDNRSSVLGGVAGSWPVAGQFGEIESADTIEAARWLSDQSWVDAKRIAITGWSFGGYLVNRVMTRSDRFVAGVAGGSVTDWRHYDAFYTERYMGSPVANSDGYQRSSVMEDAANLSGDLLLIHGEVDDNVHPRGTLDFAAALQNAGKQFELMIYPGEKHSIKDPARRYHLETMVESFLMQRLIGER